MRGSVAGFEPQPLEAAQCLHLQCQAVYLYCITPVIPDEEQQVCIPSLSSFLHSRFALPLRSKHTQ